jgi:hypothetical protein
MAQLLFSGTAPGDVYWHQMTAGPGAGTTWTIGSLFLTNSSGAPAAVQVARIFGSFSIELYNDVIADGEAVEITDITLYENQSLEVLTDEEISYSGYGTSTVQPRDPTKDVWFDCTANMYSGGAILGIDSGADRHLDYYVIPARELSLVIEVGASWIVPTGYSIPDDSWGLVIRVGATPYLTHQDARWVGWSKIGEAKFSADLVNDAGYMPMDWPGVVYLVKQLGKNVIVYGSGGVTLLYPVKEPAPTFGKQNIMLTGAMCKTAIAGDEHMHFFLDIAGVLWRLSSEGPERLGYEDYFSTLNNPILSYDSYKRYLFVSDPDNGYMLTMAGLGGGYAGITGFLKDVGGGKFIAPSAVVTPPLNIVTDVIDMKYRGLKTVESVQFGLNVDDAAYAAIDFRYSKDADWRTSHWVRLSPEGVAFIRVSGLEFRFRLQLQEYAFCEVSYLNIQYKKTDNRFVRSNMGVHHGHNPAPA